jgi:uncharacterized protein
MNRFEAGLDGVTFTSHHARLLGGFYKAAGETPRPTAVLIHGLPGIEKHLDVAYALRDRGWNCLYFHFRGCWGSQGSYSLDGLADDTHAAVEWILKQPSVDRDRVALVAASTGSHPAFLCGAADPVIRAIVGISPVIAPRAFQFPKDLADEFAGMLNGVTGRDLLMQWQRLHGLSEAITAFSPRPVLLVTAGHDSIFPSSDYTRSIAGFPNIRLVQNEESDHSFSSHRSWLVRTVTDWLLATLGC